MSTKFRVGIYLNNEPNNELEDLEPINDMPDEVVPDQTIPLSELVMRYQKGMPLPPLHSNVDFQSDDYDSLSFDSTTPRPDMDITEVQFELDSLRKKQTKRAVTDSGNAKKVVSKVEESKVDEPKD